MGAGGMSSARRMLAGVAAKLEIAVLGLLVILMFASSVTGILRLMLLGGEPVQRAAHDRIAP